MSADRIDVLAVMDADARHAALHRKLIAENVAERAAESAEARAAVAELIETQRELLLEIERAHAATTDVLQRVPSDTLQRATAALARVGGAA